MFVVNVLCGRVVFGEIFERAHFAEAKVVGSREINETESPRLGPSSGSLIVYLCCRTARTLSMVLLGNSLTASHQAKQLVWAMGPPFEVKRDKGWLASSPPHPSTERTLPPLPRHVCG